MRKVMTDLNQFQKLVVQNIYIRQLNKWLDELSWENEKKDAIIEMKDKDIEKLKEELSRSIQGREQVDANFKEYIRKVKASKVDSEKIINQQERLKFLERENYSLRKSVEAKEKMNKLLIKQR